MDWKQFDMESAALGKQALNFLRDSCSHSLPTHGDADVSAQLTALRRRGLCPEGVQDNQDLLAFQQRITKALQDTRLYEVSELTVPRFLGRILGLSIDVQQELFTYFAQVLARLDLNAKRGGKLDKQAKSLVDIVGADITLNRRKTISVAVGSGQRRADVELVTITRDRGTSWEQLLAIRQQAQEAGQEV
jgi:hypothetical protein